MSLPSNHPHRPLIVAHRGWHKIHIENTLESFRAAYEAGCELVEFDVQLSRDGVPFIFHDDNGSRLAGRHAAVYDLDWKDLKDWVMPPAKGGQAAGYRLPTLEQFLTEFGSRAFYLEMKVPKSRSHDDRYWQVLGDKCASMVNKSSPKPETFLASFHAPLLNYLGRTKTFPHLVGIFESLSKFQETLTTRSPALDRYALSWGVYRGYLKSMGSVMGSARTTSAGPPANKILLWDIHSASDMEAAVKDGVYALVADDVPTMLRVSRGT